MSGLFAVDDHVIVCGYGRTGQSVARDLSAESVPVVVIERSPELASRAESDGHLSVLGDALDPESLKEAGIERARGIILTLPSDSDSVLATMTARELNGDVFIVARNTTAHVKAKLLKVGANRVVNPFEQQGARLGTEFIRPAVMDLMRIFSESTKAETDSEVRVREVPVESGSELEGRTLRNLDVRANLDVIVIAMRRQGTDTRFNPDPDRTIEVGDVLVCMGRLANLKALAAMGQGPAA